MAEDHQNAHLAVVFDLMLPALEAAGIRYWVYGGVGVAGALGRFLRHNADVDVYVVEEDFDKAQKALSERGEREGWIVEEPKPLRQRRKLEVWIARAQDGKRFEFLSVVPVFPSGEQVLFVAGRDALFDELLPSEALTRDRRAVAEYRFWTPPVVVLKRLLASMFRERPDQWHRKKRRLDARALFTESEMRSLLPPVPPPKPRR